MIAVSFFVLVVVLATSDGCVTTTGGNAGGACCVFPFTYQGKQYNQCTNVNNGNQGWCATTTNYEADGKWGNCPFQPTCNSQNQKTFSGKCCVFPFTYKGKNTYNACTNENYGDTLWCGLDAQANKWEKCQDVCYRDGTTYKKGDTFNSASTCSTCTCHSDQVITCVPLCPPIQAQCNSNEKVVMETKQTGVAGCTCQVPKCVSICPVCPALGTCNPGFELKTTVKEETPGCKCTSGTCVLKKNVWILQATNVCFGTRDNQPGSFTMKNSGRVSGMKLVHRSGSVSCGGSGHSNWGCGDPDINVVITNQWNSKVYPKYSQHSNIADLGWYRLSGYTSRSRELVFDDPGTTVAHGQQFKVWYAEDLLNKTEEDNSGRACADVYAKYK